MAQFEIQGMARSESGRGGPATSATTPEIRICQWSAHGSRATTLPPLLKPCQVVARPWPVTMTPGMGSKGRDIHHHRRLPAGEAGTVLACFP
ncbi:MAG TPA: hypothetical protein DD643_06555 [Synechococcus sp. UBA8638]|uniref:hypothetical protein n=1 Tax=Candidatus Synechococcus spongiarum TaxID=431041 RepID=UPI000471A6AA|nr:hypothetical protein [Candidatus Synechococcus spongiarum]HBP54006.1 hypothetical protein [Synechococcus sp. UBA8638]